jgi:hypothetical protein
MPSPRSKNNYCNVAIQKATTAIVDEIQSAKEEIIANIVSINQVPDENITYTLDENIVPNDNNRPMTIVELQTLPYEQSMDAPMTMSELYTSYDEPSRDSPFGGKLRRSRKYHHSTHRKKNHLRKQTLKRKRNASRKRHRK